MVKTIEDAMLAIKSNEFLSEDLIRSIASSLIDYSSAKKEAQEPVNLDLFCQNIASVKTEKISKFDLPVANYRFTPKTSTLILNEENYNSEETNKDNVGAQIMLDVLYSNSEYTGFGIPFLSALNKGFREDIANNLAGNEKINDMPSDEYVFVNLLSVVVPEATSIFLEAYTQNKPVNVVKLIKENNLEDLIRKVEYNSVSINNSNGKSLLGEIQTELISRYPDKKEELEKIAPFNEMYSDKKHEGLASYADSLYTAKTNTELTDINSQDNIVPFPVSQENDKVLESLQKTM